MIFYQNSTKKGFTLIEVLVVISIVGILVVFSVVAFSVFRTRARDSQRVAYIKEINQALDLYYFHNGIYPTAITAGQNLAVGNTVYLNPMPNNPAPRADGACPDKNFSYSVSPDNSKYSLSVCLGGNTGALEAGTVVCDGATCQTCGDYQFIYDGVTYTTVQVGGQCWMGQNLRTKIKPDGTCINGYATPCPDASAADNSFGRRCYNNTEANCVTDGALYTWTAAMNGSTTEGARGICPLGWHIPTDAEFYTLESYLSDPGQTCDSTRSGTGAFDCATAGTKLKSGGTSGLNFPMAGFFAGTTFYGNRISYAIIWASTPVSGSQSRRRDLYPSYITINRYYSSNDYGLSIRCLKD